jgi:hypothetical protein
MGVVEEFKAKQAAKAMIDSVYKEVYKQITQTVYKELNQKIEEIKETQANINNMQEELNNRLNTL